MSEPLTKIQLDEEHFLKKEWARYLHQQHELQMSQLNRALKSQKIALDELKKDNITLYNMAIQVKILIKTHLYNFKLLKSRQIDFFSYFRIDFEIQA